MSEKGKKKKDAGKRAAKRAADVPGVLGNLPASRPAKLGRAAREARLAAASGGPDAASRAAAKDKPKGRAKDAPKVKNTPKPKKTPKPKNTPKAKATPKARAKASPTARAQAGPTAKPDPLLGGDVVVPIAEGPIRRRAEAGDQVPAGPRPVRAGAPDLPGPDRDPRPEAPPRPEPPSGTELITTAIKAAGELAGIGLTLGAQAARRTIERLPKPW